MSLRELGTSIPAGNGYPGLVCRKLSDTREICAVGSGAKVERVVEAMAQKIVSETEKGA